MSETITILELVKVLIPVILCLGGALWKLSSDISRLQANQRNIQEQMISQKEFYELLNKIENKISALEIIITKRER